VAKSIIKQSITLRDPRFQIVLKKDLFLAKKFPVNHSVQL